MSAQNSLAKFGIDEIYIHNGLTQALLEKLNQRTALCLDGEDAIVRKHVAHDMVLIFHNRVPSPSVIYRFLEFLDQAGDKEDFIRSNTLLNEDELFSAIKSAKFVLVSKRIFTRARLDQSISDD